MKDIDLNKTPHMSMVEENNDHMQDEIIRRRIKERSSKCVDKEDKDLEKEDKDKSF